MTSYTSSLFYAAAAGDPRYPVRKFIETFQRTIFT